MSGDVTKGFLKRFDDLLAGQEKYDVEITGGSISNVDLTGIASIELETPLAVSSGGTGATTATLARQSLDLEIGVDVQAYNVGLASISGLTTSADKGIYTTASNVYSTFALTAAGRELINDANATAQRSTLGLGSMATQSSGSVAITGGTITGLTSITLVTPLAVTSGGTGSATSATARENLGLKIGTNVQAWNTNLDSLAGYTVIDDDTMASASSTKLATSESIKAYVNAEVSDINTDIGDINTDIGDINIALDTKAESTLGTVQATTSGTLVDFTVPAGVIEFTVIYGNHQVDVGDDMIIRLGDSGGIETTDYSSIATDQAPSDNTRNTLTSGFLVKKSAGNDTPFTGSFTCYLVDPATNTWVGTGCVSSTTSTSSISNGVKSLSGVLTTVRITTVGGDAMNGGKVNIIYKKGN